MPESASWRDLLGDIISDHDERERIANEIGVRSITLTRWVNSESKPRPHNVRQLLHALPKRQRDQLSELLEEEYVEISDSPIGDQPDEVEYAFIRQVFETRATTPANLLFWSLSRRVIQQALRRLDPERVGMSITLVQCMPPSSDGKIHSLRESVGLGTPPWPGDLEQQAIFLGAESLAGHVVTNSHSETINDLRADNSLLPAYQTEYEVSASAHPIMYTNRVAGCLLISSTQPNYFLPQARLSLISDFTQLISLAFTPEQFYPLDRIELRIMPSLEVQRDLFTTFQQRIIAVMKESLNASHPLSRFEAEQSVWKQFEEELIYTQHSS
jgi:hypothetical protein